MIVTNDKRREIAAKVRDVMGELATIELDGIPLADLIDTLREGETVWHEDGTDLRVVGFGHDDDGETLVEVERVSGPTDWGECRSLSLTHQCPDSWEQLEDDARQLDIDLNDTTDEYPRMSCCRDLVRRAKALAERGK